MKHSRVATDAEKSAAEKRKSESDAMSRALHTGHDCWGSCCWNCQWHGEPIKPCHCCEEWREALR